MKYSIRNIAGILLPAMILYSNSAFSLSPTPSYELRDILEAPFISELIHTDGEYGLAWVANHEGHQNIWMFDQPGSDPKSVTLYDEDNGLPISDVTYLADQRRFIYAHGSPFNPTSDARGPQQQIKSIAPGDAEPQVLVEGSNPVVSPNEEYLLFTDAGNVYKIDTEGKADPEQLFHARGSNHSFQWSPDGNRVLFVSSRDAHSFVGIYHIEDEEIQWLAPDVYRDNYPVWSPDGESVAFIRIPGRKHQEPAFWRSDEVRFSILACDVDPGTCDEVWQTETGGGFAQSYSDTPLKWAADDHLIFFSEHTGWINLYAYSLQQEQLIPLAEGDFEVEDIALSPDGETIVFNSNRDAINWRNIWQVSVSGGQAEQLTETGTVDWNPVFTANGQIGFITSDYRYPGRTALLNPDQPESVELISDNLLPSGFPGDQMVEPEEVAFTAADGVEVHGQLFLPEDVSADHPAIIYMHGGPIRQMYPAWHSRVYYHYNYAFNQYLASKGYVVLSVNFRSGIGYGADFRTAPEQGPAGASEYQDILAAADFLQQSREVDPLRIGLWGGSYGGYLTALGLARDSDLFKAGVDLHGVHDWALRGIRRNGGGWGIYTEEQMEEARRSSPIHDLRYWTSPVLFVHADDDRNVDFIQTTDLVNRLESIGKAHVETLVFPDDVHSFMLHRNWLKTFEVSADFFDRFME